MRAQQVLSGEVPLHADELGPLQGNLQLVSRLDIVRTEAEKAALLEALCRVERPTVVSFLNQHGFNLSWENVAFRRALLDSTILLRDGIGISVTMRLLRREAGLNLNGTDLIPIIAQRYAHRRVLVAGTASPFLDRSVEVLKNKACDIVAAVDGFQDDDRYLEEARRHRPELIILGMGMPKQERIAALLAQSLDFPVLIVNGGAILDFLSGRVRRAPPLFRMLRIEWAFRLLLEPRRMFKRYVTGGVVFLLRILRLARLAKAKHLAGK